MISQMPKNTKRFKNAKNNTHAASKRELILKSENQEYAQATRMLGNNKIECSCFDDKIRLGVIRKTMRRGKKNRINLDDIVLVSLREFQDDKADILYVYDNDEVKQLRKMYEIPDIDTGEGVQDDLFKMSDDEECEKKVSIDDI